MVEYKTELCLIGCWAVSSSHGALKSIWLAISVTNETSLYSGVVESNIGISYTSLGMSFKSLQLSDILNIKLNSLKFNTLFMVDVPADFAKICSKHYFTYILFCWGY